MGGKPSCAHEADGRHERERMVDGRQAGRGEPGRTGVGRVEGRGKGMGGGVGGWGVHWMESRGERGTEERRGRRSGGGGEVGEDIQSSGRGSNARAVTYTDSSLLLPPR